MKISKCWKVAEFQKNNQLKWKIVKHFTRSKQRAILRKLFSLPSSHPHWIKPYYVFGTNIFFRRYREIQKHLLSKCFKNTVLGRQEIVRSKCFFWHQTESCLPEHFLLENLKIKKKLWWSSLERVDDHLYFGPNFVCGDSSRAF